MEAVILAKRVHTYRSPLLSLWSRNELADNVVAFLPPTNLPKLPVIAKPFRAAQPMVLFTAARRLKVVDQMLASCVDVLREAVAGRCASSRRGQRQQMDPNARRRLFLDRLRAYAFEGNRIHTARRVISQLRITERADCDASASRKRWSAADTISGAVGYVWLELRSSNFSEQYVGGVYRNGGGHLCFLSRNRHAEVHTTLLCPVTLGTRYDIDASFSDADADDR